MLEQLFPNVNWDNIIEATIETLYMTGISVLATFIIRHYFRFDTVFNR